MRKIPSYLLSMASAPFALAEGDDTGTLYRKEVAHPGHFVKKDAKTGEITFELDIDEPMIDQWVETFKKMKTNGVEVPCPVGHVNDPEKRRATVEDMRKEKNSKGQPALFAYVRFSSPDFAADLKDSQVSLFMPPDQYDGKGNRYVRPVKHVAFTDYPVIPGLDKFEPVRGQAASLTIALSLAEEDTMGPYAELAQELGIEVPEGASEDECRQAIVDEWNKDEEGGEGAGAAGSGEGEEEIPPETGEEEPEHEEMGMGAGAGFDLDFSDTRPQVHPRMVKREMETRRARLDALVNDPAGPKISPAVRDKLVKQYCAQDAVALSLENETMEMPGDEFDNLVAALSLNPPIVRPRERTAMQDLATGRTKSSVVESARRRAEEAKRR